MADNLTHAQMVAVLNRGGGVMFNGRIYTKVADLPSDDEIAAALSTSASANPLLIQESIRQDFPAALGQATSALSLPVVLSSDQSAISTYDAGPVAGMIVGSDGSGVASVITSGDGVVPITEAPDVSHAAQIIDLLISVTDDCTLTIWTQDGGAALFPFHMAGKTTIQITTRSRLFTGIPEHALCAACSAGTASVLASYVMAAL